MTKKKLQAIFLLVMSMVVISCGGSSSDSNVSSDSNKPNILFVIMDDVGIDQMAMFGYGGNNPPSMPNMAVVANAGVRFRNTWSMPECSPGRASMFVGRFPFRTNIPGAIGQNDLANSQLSPYDMTTPKLLKQANYESGMFGKFHLAGPENNAAGNGTPGELGWDYFYGWVGGLPASIDTTAGGVGAKGAHPCGYVKGADSGACYQADNSCSQISAATSAGEAPGKACAMSGGIFVAGQSCQSSTPPGLNFGNLNAFYVSPLVINQGGSVTEVPATDPRSRGYRTTIEADAAIGWINSRQRSKPWMATVSFSSAHTPLQQAPAKLAPVAGAAAEAVNCQNMSIPGQQTLQNQMTEAMDTEFGRLMVETGLATRDKNGRLIYDPKATNTMIVIVGDNGTLGGSVKTPFNMNRAKGTAYQTGVWVPLIVAGPLVNQPGREVNHMTNMVDVFQLFGEIAGLNVPALVPRVIDSAPLLPYLTNATQSSIRTVNFTHGSYNIQANGGRNAPCVMTTSCTQVPISKSVCEDNAGVWWGPGYSDPSVIPKDGGYASCCAVNQAKYNAQQDQLTIIPETTYGVRNDRYKLVQNIAQQFDSKTNSCNDANGKPLTTTTTELFEINQDPGSNVKIDNTALDYVGNATLTQIYNDLLSQLNSILASQPACSGDANIDGQVNGEDLSIWQKFLNWALSSVADFNFDGLTNDKDAQIIRSNQGVCPKATSTY
jgi:hypothetical protein